MPAKPGCYFQIADVLVQNSAGNLLQNVLGWEVVLAYNSEKLGPDGTLGLSLIHI